MLRFKDLPAGTKFMFASNGGQKFIKVANPQRYFRPDEENGRLNAICLNTGCAYPVDPEQRVEAFEIHFTEAHFPRPDHVHGG